MCELLCSSDDASQETDMLQKLKATALGLTISHLGMAGQSCKEVSGKLAQGPMDPVILRFPSQFFFFLLNLHKTEPRPELYLNLIL